MQIFISWSGAKSKEMATILSKWLPLVFPHLNFFISHEIEKGANFLEKILQALNESSIGIFLLTKGNTSAPWIQFEAGAFASKGLASKICPLYIDDDIEIDDTGPLRFFQGSLINENDIFKLLSSINSSLESPFPNERLLKLFDSNKKEFFYNWNLIKNIPAATGIHRTTNKEFLAKIARDVAEIKWTTQRNDGNTINLITAFESLHSIEIPRAGPGSGGIIEIKQCTAPPGVMIPRASSRFPDGGDFSSEEEYRIASGELEFEYRPLSN